MPWNRYLNNIKQKARPHAYAFFALLIDFRTTSRLLFFSTITLNRPKSFNTRRFSTASLFFAQLLDSHLAMVPSASSCFLMTPAPAARGSFVSVRGVRMRCLKG